MLIYIRGMNGQVETVLGTRHGLGVEGLLVHFHDVPLLSGQVGPAGGSQEGCLGLPKFNSGLRTHLAQEVEQVGRVRTVKTA